MFNGNIKWLKLFFNVAVFIPKQSVRFRKKFHLVATTNKDLEFRQASTMKYSVNWWGQVNRKVNKHWWITLKTRDFYDNSIGIKRSAFFEIKNVRFLITNGKTLSKLNIFRQRSRIVKPAETHFVLRLRYEASLFERNDDVNKKTGEQKHMYGDKFGNFIRDLSRNRDPLRGTCTYHPLKPKMYLELSHHITHHLPVDHCSFR